MWKAAVLLAVLATVAPFAAAASGIYGVNGSEPAFLGGVGPQDDRADSPLAAGVVAVGVALVVLRGLYRYGGEG